MYTAKSSGIVQYNANDSRVEILRPVNASERANPESFYQLEEFLTGTVIQMVATKDLNHFRQHENLHVWGKELYTMEMYVNLLRDVHRMVIVHGPNTEVFGPQPDQGFIMKSIGNKMHVGMQVTNQAVLMALDTHIAGIMADGTILREGTVSSFDSFVAMAQQRVDNALSIITTEASGCLRRQWDQAAGLEIHEIQHFYVRNTSTDWKDYLDLQRVMDILNVSHTTINRYRAGQVPAGCDPFPKPDRFRGRSPYWHKNTIDGWIVRRVME
ncbi:hypothetical protein PA10_00254 [Pseudomonas phage pPa_SNUABM_DT01]|nr:hypothetical protein PA10_00254 [Pseudomonas phage pPa_SNUABM_DT01]